MTFRDRNRLILQMRLGGSTYREIAKQFEISKARAAQICQATIAQILGPMAFCGGVTTPEDVYLETEILKSPYLIRRRINLLDIDVGDY